jgi:hypothetical protein
VVAAHAVEVDAEHERRRVGLVGLQRQPGTAPRKSSAASMNPNCFGVAK